MNRSDRPIDNRPAGHPGPTEETIDSLLAELTRTRFDYDDLRAADGSLHDRTELRDKLHTLRQQIARVRRTDLGR